MEIPSPVPVETVVRAGPRGPVAAVPSPRREAARAFCPARGPSPLALLAAGVPLTLLLDLADPAGPDSQGILATERAETPVWLAG